MRVTCCIGARALVGLFCVPEWAEEQIGGRLWGCLLVSRVCEVEGSVGLLFDVRSMRIGGEGLWVCVGVCSCGEGAGSVRGAVRWPSDACGAWCRWFDERTGEALSDACKVCAKWEKMCVEKGIGRISASVYYSVGVHFGGMGRCLIFGTL